MADRRLRRDQFTARWRVARLCNAEWNHLGGIGRVERNTAAWRRRRGHHQDAVFFAAGIDPDCGPNQERDIDLWSRGHWFERLDVIGRYRRAGERRLARKLLLEMRSERDIYALPLP